MHRGLWLLLVGIVALFQCNSGLCSSLIHKNYIVRYNGGWDILCEPYVVQNNDSLLKIFRQKGEIAHQDYQDFLGIFKKLNPHIRNVDLIRPGQRIDIPLRKMEHGTLPGQASGVITITFVSLGDVTEIVQQYSKPYTVKKGDMVSILISRNFGRYGSKLYREGIQLFRAANPDVTNLELIYVGQRLNIPDPAIRDNPWYANMYDDQGSLRENVDQTPPLLPNKTKQTTAPPPIEAVVPEPEISFGNLAIIAECVGGHLKAKGSYYLPLQGIEEFELDLSKHPMLEFGNGAKLVFSSDNKIMDFDNDTFQTYWPELKPVTVDADSSYEQYVAAIFNALNEDSAHAEELIIKKHGVQITVRAKYVRTEDEGNRLCVTPIAKAVQQTPVHLRRYLEQNRIVIKEIIQGGTVICSNHVDVDSPKVKNALFITPTSQKDFVRHLADKLGFSYIPNASITFPYAGIQVEAYGNLLSTNTGKEILVDYSDLYGDAIAAIGKTGLNVVQIRPDDNYDLIAQKLLTSLSIPYEQHPTLLAAKRSAEYNTAIKINGILCRKNQNRRILLTSADLHQAVTEMLNTHGIDVLAW